MRVAMAILNVHVSTETRILLDALSALMQTPTGRVVEVLTLSYVRALPAQEARIINDLRGAAESRLAAGSPSIVGVTPAPVATYKFSRICFKRDVIEALGPNDSFRVETPIGTFQMSKTEFYRVFPNVVQSRSYSQDGIYHYRTLPRQAEQFRIL
jgi:hypothetical protein